MRRSVGVGLAGAVIALGVAVASASTATQARWPTTGWEGATVADAGLLPEPLGALDTAIRAGTFGYVDRVTIVRGGRLVIDTSYDNDYREISRGHSGPLGCGWESCTDPAAERDDFNYFHPDVHPYYRGRPVHTLQSVSKSVSSTVLAAAIHNGAISGIDVTLLDFLADYDLTRVDPRLHDATLEDLLTMRSGIEWHEQDRPLDETNTTYRLEHAQDWVQFTLDEPMDAAPGTKWAYNSGGSQLMSAIVRKTTGMTLATYAEEHLFGPLGIEDYYWKHTPAGLPDALGGLYLDALDLAKIGYLMLNDGVWEGDRLLPAGWARRATQRHVESVNAAGWGYGYQWWRPDTGGVEIWAGMGFGGQFLLVLPDHGVVAVANSWNVFGSRNQSILRGLIGALLESLAV